MKRRIKFSIFIYLAPFSARPPAAVNCWRRWKIFNDTKNSSKTHRDRCSYPVSVTFTQGVGNVRDEVIAVMWIITRAGVYLKRNDKTQLWYQVIALYTFVVTVFEYFGDMATTNDKEKLVFYLKCLKHFAELLIKHLAVNCPISSIL